MLTTLSSTITIQYDHNTKKTTDVNPPISYPDDVRTIARGINKYNKVVGAKWGGVEGLEKLL